MPMAIPLLAAYGAVTAGMAAAAAGSMIVGGMMVAGGMMTAIGAINGDKQLSKYGGLLSLAGGIGGMATGAWDAAAQNIAEESTNAGYVNQMDAASDAASAANATGQAASQMPTMPDMDPGASNIAGPPMDAGASADQWMNYDGSVQQAAAPPGLPPAATPPPEIPGATPPAATAPTAATPVAPAPSAPAAPVQQAPYSQRGSTARTVTEKLVDANPKGTGSSNPVSGLFDWAAANPRAAQAGSGLLQAGLGYYGQQDAVKTSIRLNEEAQARARSRMSDSVKGLNMPVYQKKGG